MNIVMFTDAYWPRVNGVTVSVDSYSRALVKAGHEVLIVCSRYPKRLNTAVPLFGAPGEEDGPKILRVPSMPAFVTKEDRLAIITKFFWVFKQVELFKPEIIHVNTEMMIAEFGFWYARSHNLPAIYTFHTMWEDYGPNYFPMFPPVFVKFVIRNVLKNILRRSYRVIVPTPQIDEVVRRYKSKTKTVLLPTGIETELFRHSGAEAEVFREKFEALYPALKGKRILLFAGRVAREKNIGFLLKILPGIISKHPDAVLLIAGNGPDQEFYRAEARNAKIEDACVFTGYLNRKDLALVYAVSELFLFPSLTDTQGLVTLEAMLSGTPVVAIGALGTLMVMNGDNGGFMVKNDEAEFSARVLELLGDSGLRRAKSLEAKNHARSWSIDELTKKLLEVYKTAAGTYRREHGGPRIPLWENLLDKKWWKASIGKPRKKTKQE